MTGTHRLQGHGGWQGPGAGLFGQIGRWLMLGAMFVAAAFMLFFSAAFALVLVGTLSLVVLIAVSVFWVRAKLTGRPFGPRAHMNAQMDELRRQMGVDMRSPRTAARPASDGPSSSGPVIDAHETPEGWTVER
ncbi:MAG: hypothetical protein AAF311_05320 [Pseudomonadota bacterium]